MVYELIPPHKWLKNPTLKNTRSGSLSEVDPKRKDRNGEEEQLHMAAA